MKRYRLFALIMPLCVACKTPLMQVGPATPSTQPTSPLAKADVNAKADITGNVKGVETNRDTKQIQHGDNNKIVEVTCSWTERVGMPLLACITGWLVGKLSRQPKFMQGINADPLT